MTKITPALLAVALLMAGCAKPPPGFAELGTPESLTITVTDPAWTNGAVARKHWCKRHGGKGASPTMTVVPLPAGTTAVVVEFSDETHIAMDKGGHGILRFALPPGSTVARLPSVPGETEDLPDGVTLVRGHAGRSWTGTGGAYLPPCSGGRGNTYTATVKAVSGDANSGLVLAKGKVVLGHD